MISRFKIDVSDAPLGLPVTGGGQTLCYNGVRGKTR